MTDEITNKDIDSFEKAIDQLEQIVRTLEEGKITLDEALQQFEMGIKLSRFCNNKLSEAEKRINILLKQDDGSITVKPADLSDS